MNFRERTSHNAEGELEEPVLLNQVLREEEFFKEIMHGVFFSGMSLDQAWEGMEIMIRGSVRTPRPKAFPKSCRDTPSWISISPWPEKKEIRAEGSKWKPLSPRGARRKKEDGEKAKSLCETVKSPVKKVRPGKGRLVLLIFILAAVIASFMLKKKSGKPPSPLEPPRSWTPAPPGIIPPEEDGGWRRRVITE